MDKIAQTAEKAVFTAGRIILDMYKNPVVSSKGKNNLVTEADIKSEKAIISSIKETYPDHKFLGEEGGQKERPDAENLWIIDPLDGTNNYAHHIPHFCISIAYARKGEICFGAIYDPLREELYTAAHKKGARKNGKPISVSKPGVLDRSIIATGFYYDRGEIMERTLESIRALFKRDIRGIRRLGSAALDLCWVADGRFDGFFEYRLSVWDFAAGILIAKEAGALCSDRNLAPVTLESKSIIASSPDIYEKLCEVVNWKV